MNVHDTSKILRSERSAVKRVRTLIAWLGLLAAPTTLLHVYIVKSRSAGAVDGYMDFVAIVFAILCGLSFVWCFPIPRQSRVIASLGYAPLAFVVLTLYGFFRVISLGYSL